MYWIFQGSVPETYKRCCQLGNNWAEEDLVCASFPTPVAGVAQEFQKICLTAVSICCNQKLRDKQCQDGVKAAKNDESCIRASNKPGADSFKVRQYKITFFNKIPIKIKLR